MNIRKAKSAEYELLTEISFDSKRYWKYPDKYFEIWKNELTITKEYIVNNDVFVIQNNENVVGYYSIVNLQKDIEVSGIKLNNGYWLEHMFVLPRYLGQKVGSKMLNHLKNCCKEKCLTQVSVLADPHSKGFYEKMGFIFQKDYPSSISGRTTPLLILQL